MVDSLKLGEYARMLNAQTAKVVKSISLVQHVDGIKLIRLVKTQIRVTGSAGVNTSERVLYNSIDLFPHKIPE